MNYSCSGTAPLTPLHRTHMLHTGNHEGHDFVMYMSESGGCCDCGDPGSWKPEGFCPRHQAPSADAPPLSLAPEEAALLRALLHVVMRVVGLQCGLQSKVATGGDGLLPSATWEGVWGVVVDHHPTTTAPPSPGDLWTAIHWLKGLCSNVLLRGMVVNAAVKPLQPSHSPAQPTEAAAALQRAGDDVAQRAQRALGGGVWLGQQADGSVTFTAASMGSLLLLPATLQEVCGWCMGATVG